MTGGLDLDALAMVAIRLALVVFSIMVHEVAHGAAAWRLGDPTAKAAGRLTLNPVKHLDPFGSVLLPLLMTMAGGPIFAFAKPVPYNPTYFKDRRRGEVAVAFAGPGSNLAQACAGGAVCWACTLVPVDGLAGARALAWVFYIGQYFCLINLWLCFFNMLPLPPLDGASIVALFLDERGMEGFYRVKSYSMFILILLLFVVPAYTAFDPIGWYFDHTAGVLAGYLLPGA